MNINFNIDQLVLHGFNRLDRHQVSQAIQTELNRLITEQGVSKAIQQNQHIRNLNAGEIKLKTNAGPRQIGTQVARNLYQGLPK